MSLPAIQVAPDWGATGTTASPRLFGHNTVFSRGGLGLWDDTASALVPDAVGKVKGLAPGVLRIPGGTRAMRYHFKNAIGHKAMRQPECDTFTGALDGTGYGLPEMLALAEQVGAEVTLVAPWVDGSPQETAALVAYVNGATDHRVHIGMDASGTDWGDASDWAMRRVQDGHAAPYRVSFLEIGNETYLDLSVGPQVSCGRHSQFRQNERWVGSRAIPTTVRDYAAQVAQTGALVHAIDPALRVGACAILDLAIEADARTTVAPADEEAETGDAWDLVLSQQPASAFDFYILHPYDFAGGDARLALTDKLRAAVHDLRALDPARGIAVTEFGFLTGADTQASALVAADVVRMAAEEQLELVVRHILIEDNPEEPFASNAAILGPGHDLTPAYQAMAWLAQGVPGQVAQVNSPGMIGVLGTRGTGGSVTVVLIDRDPADGGSDAFIDVSLPAGITTGVVHTQSGGLDDGTTELTVGDTPASISGGRIHLRLPRHGLVVARLAASAAGGP
jgi:hypothetical protein